MELEETMKELKIPKNDFAAKFFNIKKFKYMPSRLYTNGVSISAID
jgi:hypothetical protein